MKNRDLAVRMAQKGEPPRVIAPKLKLAPITVSGYLTTARKAGVDVPRFKGAARIDYRGMRCPVAWSTVSALEPAADERGIEVHQLIRELLARIADDDLVDAILDDKEPDA